MMEPGVFSVNIQYYKINIQIDKKLYKQGSIISSVRKKNKKEEFNIFINITF